jgi:putative secretion ATPase (PEP-CTERM system associated)
MYERFYHLRDRPFALSPDPDYLYPSRVHREALDYLRFGIEGHAGFVVITGEIGSGKTTLLQVLLRNLDGQTTVIRLVNTLLTGRELLESMLLDLGMENPPQTKPAMLRELARLLIEQRASGRRVVAVIDEAQNLSREALEELRMLSNLETEKSKLIQIVLVGQPDLRDALEDPTLEQLRQRVTVRYHIDPLDPPETSLYINHRLKRAAIGAPLEFPSDVTSVVHARSGGVPRLINVICDAVLLCGYAEESHQIDLPLVRSAIDELESSSVLRRSNGASSNGNGASSVKSSVPAMPPPNTFQAAPVSASAAVPSQPVRGVAPVAPPTASPVAQRPVSAAPSMDLPLRQPEPAMSTAKPEVRPAADVRQPSRPVAIPVAHARPAPPKPAAFRAEPPRHAGAWHWMKTVILGLPSEEGRR